MADLPPLPPGLTLDNAAAQAPQGDLPPLPQGLTLDQGGVTPQDPVAAPPEHKTALGRIAAPLTDFPAAQRLEAQESIDQGKEAINQLFEANTLASRGWATFKLVGAGLDYVTSPARAAFRTLAGDPLERLTKVRHLSETIAQDADIAAQLGIGLPKVEKLGDIAQMMNKSRVGSAVERALSPTTVSEKSREAELVIRARSGELAQAREVVATEMEKYRKAMMQLPVGEVKVAADGSLQITPNSRLEFINAIETGEIEHLPDAIRPTAEFLRKNLDHWRDRVQSLGKGYLEHAFETYFPHLWERGPAVDAFTQEMARTMAKRPLKGSSSFMKHRTIGTVAEGIAKGLIPISDNPLDLALLRINGLQKFYYGHVMLDEMKTRGLVKFSRRAGSAPEGWVALEGNEFSVFAPARNQATLDDLVDEFGPDLKKGLQKAGVGIGPQLVGHYYAPPEVANIFRNYLSKGLRGGALYDSIRSAGNAINQAQLAIPLFHLLFTTQDTVVSEMARAVEAAGAKDWKQAAKSTALAHTLVGPAISGIIKGSRLKKAYLDVAHATPEMRSVVDMLKAGGGRVKMDHFYRVTEAGSFYRSLKDGTALQEIFGTMKKHPVKGLPMLLGRAIETMADPVMGYVVPRQKLGVFYNLAQDWLRRNPGASADEMRAAATMIWDSVDNRLGQMVYDNLFWGKVQKDLAFLGVRSVGWNLGTIRELGGGATDTMKAAYKLVAGQDPELTHRMAYTFALPYIIGIQGAVMTYLFTGHGPEHMIDYFAPPTGGTTSYGSPERVLIPSYMKDVIEYNQAPFSTLLTKTHPLFETARELYTNRDFYGAMIVDDLDPGTKQLMDYLRYFSKQALPFSVRQTAKAEENPQSAIPAGLPMLGINPAPISITDPALLSRIQQTSAEARHARKKKLRNESK